MTKLIPRRHFFALAIALRHQPWLWPIIIVASAFVATLLTAADFHFALRPPLVVWFLFVCPGMAIVRLLRIGRGYSVLTLAITISLALDALVASIMLYAGAWSPPWVLAIIAVLTLGAVAMDVLRRPGEPG